MAIQAAIKTAYGRQRAATVSCYALYTSFKYSDIKYRTVNVNLITW